MNVDDPSAKTRAEPVAETQARSAGPPAPFPNPATELENLHEQLRRSQRMASLGTMAAGLAHKVNNLVGTILLSAQNAQRRAAALPADDQIVRSLARIADNARRCGDMVRIVLQLAQREPAEQRPNDLNTVVRCAVEQARPYAAEQGAVVRTDLAADLPPVVMNPPQIEQVVVHLIRNAIESADAGAQVVVRTAGRAGSARLTVQDNGRGMTPDQRTHAFDPFYTTRQREGGAGLGLSFVQGIIADHQGAIEIISEPGAGTAVHVDLRTGEARAKENGNAPSARG